MWKYRRFLGVQREEFTSRGLTETTTSKKRSTTKKEKKSRTRGSCCVAEGSKQQVVPDSLTLLCGRHQAVHLVGLRDVQLRALCHLLELGALVEGAAEAGLPRRRAVTAAIVQFAFKVGPGLHNTEGQRSGAVGVAMGSKRGSSHPDLEDGSVLILAEVLLPSVLPRDAEHGLGLVVPNQARIFTTAHLHRRTKFTQRTNQQNKNLFQRDDNTQVLQVNFKFRVFSEKSTLRELKIMTCRSLILLKTKLNQI